METASFYRLHQAEVIHLKNRPLAYAEHNHVTVYTLGFVLSGSVTLRRGNVSKVFPPQSHFVIAPWQMHTLSLPANYEMVTVCIDRHLPEQKELSALLHFLTCESQTLLACIDKAVLACALREVYAYENKPQPDDSMRIGACALYKAPECNAGVPLLASHACYSLSHYIKIFKRCVGMTPHKFQMQGRVRLAQKMLENGAMAADTAATLGFCDQSHFIKSFKQIVGFTPAEYRMAAKRIP